MMMLNTFERVREEARKQTQRKICVAVAHDDDVLEAVVHAFQEGLASFILVGDREKILRIAEKRHMDLSEFEILDEKDDLEAARMSVEMVGNGEADILMKGLIQTGDLFRFVLDKNSKLRTGRILSHIMAHEIEGYDRLLFITDTGLNIAPDVNKKAQIVQNAVDIVRKLGVQLPVVAALAALELVNTDMPSTVDAALLSKMCDRGQIHGCILDGPLAMDNAISAIAAKRKKIASVVPGVADILLVPDLEVGNILSKALLYLANAKGGGVVVGAKSPIIMVSRADTHEIKLNSIALSMLL